MTKFTRLIFKNLLRNKRRTVLHRPFDWVSLFIFAVLVSLPTLRTRCSLIRTSSVRIVSAQDGICLSAARSFTSSKLPRFPCRCRCFPLVIYAAFSMRPAINFQVLLRKRGD